MRMYADFPVWLLPVIITIIFIAGGYLFVRSSGIKKWSILIRTFVWLGLILLISNPWLSWEENEIRNPRIGIWIDRSLSMDKGALDSLAKIISAIDSMDFILKDMSTGEYLETDKLMPISQYTDFTRLENGMAEIDALWLISDGNPNQGKRNVKLSPDQPLNVIATGDTARKGDLYIIDLIYSRKMYVNIQDTLIVYIASDGYETKRSAIVKIKQNNRVLKQASVKILPGSEAEIKIPLKFIRKGMKNIKVELLGTGEDNNMLNNSIWAGINVESSQKNILLLNGYPIPEIRYIRYLLRDRKDLTFNQSLAAYTEDKSKKPDAIICFAYPIKPLTAKEKDFWQWMYDQNVPVLFFSHEGVKPGLIKELNLSLQQIPGGSMEMFPAMLAPDGEKSPVINPDFLDRDKIVQFLSRRPPLVRDFRLDIKGKSLVLLNSIKDSGPGGFFKINLNAQRRIALFAGWNSYLLHASALPNEVYPYWRNVMKSTMNWLLAPPLTRGIYHNIPDTLLQNIGSNLIKFTVVDDFGNYVNDAGLSFSFITDDLHSKRNAHPEGMGYELEMPFLPVGDYKYEIIAKWGLGQENVANGRFHVANPGPEKFIRTRDESFLKGIAKGKYIPIENLRVDDFDYKQVEEINSYQFYFFPRQIILFIILGLFLLDLFLRRRYHLL